MDKFHIPKGSQCQFCVRSREDCSHLPFREYRKLEYVTVYGNPLVVVKCEEYKKRENE